MTFGTAPFRAPRHFRLDRLLLNSFLADDGPRANPARPGRSDLTDTSRSGIDESVGDIYDFHAARDPVLPGFPFRRRRQAAGGISNSRLKARLNADSDS